MKTIRLLFLLALSHTAYGGGETHGGGGLECQNGEVLLYDLYEATIPGEISPSGLKIKYSKEPMNPQVEQALNRLSAVYPEFTKLVREAYNHLLKRVQPVPDGSRLFPPTDVSGELIKEGCELKGIASYNDKRDRLLLDERLTKRMHATHLAALWVHESVYKALRETQSPKDSRSTRKLVAYLFSEEGIKSMPAFLESNLRRDGRTHQTSWRLFSNRKLSTNGYFDWRITHQANLENPDCYEAELIMFPLDENGNWIEDRVITTPLSKNRHAWHFADTNTFQFAVSRSSARDASECQYSITFFNSVLERVTTFPIYIPAKRMHSLDHVLTLKEQEQ